MLFRGAVVKKPFGVGSKSERAAVMLATAQGEYVLRRLGANPFHDPDLEKLVGKVIACEGTLHGYTLLMSSWKELAEGGNEDS